MATTAAATKSSPATAPPATSTARPKRQKDACDLLEADHKAVKALFNDYAALTESRSRSPAKKRQLADQICQALMVHTAIEEDIFYPAARSALKDNALMNEAMVEHASARDLIAQIQGTDARDEMFDARVTVLGEYIDHHVREERTEMFAKARKSRLDLVKLREQLEARKKTLMSQMQAETSLLPELSAAL